MCGLDDAVCSILLCRAGTDPNISAFACVSVSSCGGMSLLTYFESKIQTTLVFGLFRYSIVPPLARNARKYISFSEQNDCLSHLFSLYVSPVDPLHRDTAPDAGSSETLRRRWTCGGYPPS